MNIERVSSLSSLSFFLLEVNSVTGRGPPSCLICPSGRRTEDEGPGVATCTIAWGSRLPLWGISTLRTPSTEEPNEEVTWPSPGCNLQSPFDGRQRFENSSMLLGRVRLHFKTQHLTQHPNNSGLCKGGDLMCRRLLQVACPMRLSGRCSSKGKLRKCGETPVRIGAVTGTAARRAWPWPRNWRWSPDTWKLASSCFALALVPAESRSRRATSCIFI